MASATHSPQRGPYGSGLPKNVDKEVGAYLRCGILAHGFRTYCLPSLPRRALRRVLL
jgi:hypothetical protein